uniref:Uncharacterized protein n=1 Tax=Trichuris muris TaxID=70415 RepID=A0A5S6QJU3_TRIMR
MWRHRNALSKFFANRHLHHRASKSFNGKKELNDARLLTSPSRLKLSGRHFGHSERTKDKKERKGSPP